MNGRKTPLLALLVTLALGVISRVYLTGWVLMDKYLGDALYTAAIFWVLHLFWPRWPRVKASALSFGLSLGVELFQLTGWPAMMRANPALFWRLLSIALGTEFSWRDILAYGVGALSCVAISRLRSDAG